MYNGEYGIPYWRALVYEGVTNGEYGCIYGYAYGGIGGGMRDGEWIGYAYGGIGGGTSDGEWTGW